jgi:hypothetical protein
MRDIKELIYAAVEENAVKFQELVNAQLQVRAYDAIEALRPEVGASMFGEENEKKSEVDEELKGSQHKIDKNKNGKIDAHDFKLLRDKVRTKGNKNTFEEVEELDELSKKTLGSYVKKSASDHGARSHALGHSQGMDDAGSEFDDQDQEDEDQKEREDNFRKSKNRKAGIDRAVKKLTKEEVELDEVAMPQNQADWQALITHQIKTAGHPVATDAQFRATHGKDTSKIASQEPPEDKMNYAAAQGGTVKQ